MINQRNRVAGAAGIEVVGVLYADTFAGKIRAELLKS
jgi:hypothetical protein